VLRVLGLRYGDLYYQAAGERVAPRLEAVYPYVTVDGTLVAEKVRFVPKAFKWRVPDRSQPGGYRWGLQGATVPLYNQAGLVDERQVLVVEGERAVDRSRALGFAATCPPAGASVWHPEWTHALWQLGCREVIVLPDNDPPGRRHGDRVALACYAYTGPLSPSGPLEGPWAFWPSARPGDAEIAALKVKLVRLSVIAGGDVVDFFEAHQPQELRELIDATPYWTPDGAERDRLERKRAQTRERVRRQRERDRLAAAVTQRMSASMTPPHVTRRILGNPVTRNAVTQGERSSKYITKTYLCTRERAVVDTLAS
jgi:hypothetical protein